MRKQQGETSKTGPSSFSLLSRSDCRPRERTGQTARAFTDVLVSRVAGRVCAKKPRSICDRTANNSSSYSIGHPNIPRSFYLSRTEYAGSTVNRRVEATDSFGTHQPLEASTSKDSPDTSDYDSRTRDLYRRMDSAPTALSDRNQLWSTIYARLWRVCHRQPSLEYPSSSRTLSMDTHTHRQSDLATTFLQLIYCR